VTAEHREHPGPVGPEHPLANPMYARLLEAVLNEEADTPASPHTRSAGPLAEVVRRSHVLERHTDHADPDWALQGVADQLAYDAALVRLARKRGVPTDLGSFDVPALGRAQLEQALLDRGVRLPTRAAPGPEADGSH
jgi:hypothetical protein